MRPHGNAKTGPAMQIIEVEWVTGLDAPKGLRLHDHFLYAADLSKVVMYKTTDTNITVVAYRLK